MEKNKLKNMIVLKNLPSNVVEEAIVVLKPNIKIKRSDCVDGKNNIKKAEANRNKGTKDYIINEAEMVISNYISKLEKPKKEKYKVDKKIKDECKRFKFISIVLGMLLVISFLI